MRPSYELDTLRETLVATRKQLAEVKKDLAASESSAATTVRELQRLSAEVRSVLEAADVQQLMQQNEELQDKHEEVEQELHRSNQEMQALKLQLSSLQTKQKGLEEELRVARAEKSSLAGILADKEKEQRVATQQTEQIQAELKGLKTQLQTQADLASRQTQQSSGNDSADRRGQEAVDWQQQLRALQARYNELRTTCNVLTKKLVAANAALAEHDVIVDDDLSVGSELCRSGRSARSGSEASQDYSRYHPMSYYPHSVPTDWVQRVAEQICEYVGEHVQSRVSTPAQEEDSDVVELRQHSARKEFEDAGTQATARLPNDSGALLREASTTPEPACLELRQHSWEIVLPAVVKLLHTASPDQLEEFLQHPWPPSSDGEVASTKDYLMAVMGVHAIQQIAQRDAQRCARLEREMQKSTALLDNTFAENQSLLRTIADYENVILELQNRRDAIDQNVLQQLNQISSERVRRLTRREQLQSGVTCGC